jgi:K+-transporting ATPase c subunit
MNKTTKSILAFPLAALGALLGGLVTGALAGLLSTVIYIVFLFPVGMGFIAGTILEKAITGAKIRDAVQAILLGCLAAAAVMGAYHAAKYAVFRARLAVEMNQRMTEETGMSNMGVANALVDYALKEETGFSGFPGYILYMDKRGITVGRMAGSGLNLGPAFTWVFWALELAIVGYLTVELGRSAAGRRFCETCNRWYGKERHLGGIGLAQAGRLLQLLEAKDFARAGELLEAEAHVPSLEVYAQSCERCETNETWLELKQASLDGKGRLSYQPVSHMSLRPQEKADLLRVLAPGAVASPGSEPAALFARPQ